MDILGTTLLIAGAWSRDRVCRSHGRRGQKGTVVEPWPLIFIIVLAKFFPGMVKCVPPGAAPPAPACVLRPAAGRGGDLSDLNTGAHAWHFSEYSWQ